MLELGRALATSVAKGPQTTRSGAHRAAAKTLDSARLTAPDCNARAPSLASSRPRGRVVEECCMPFLGARACPVQTDANARCQSASPRSRTKRVKTHFSWRRKSCPGPQLACVCGCGAGDLAVFVTIDGGVQRAYAFLSRTLGSGPREAPPLPGPLRTPPACPGSHRRSGFAKQSPAHGHRMLRRMRGSIGCEPAWPLPCQMSVMRSCAGPSSSERPTCSSPPAIP